MSNTEIKNTWKPYLKAGEDVEQEFLMEVRKGFPKAYKKVDGNLKETDIIIPEIANLSIEIKRDLKSDETGNFAFEYECGGNPSGLVSTTSDLWVMTDSQKFYIYSTSKLKDFLHNNWAHLIKTTGGDSNLSKMVLVRKVDAIKYAVIASIERNRKTGGISLADYFIKAYNYRIGL